MVAISQDDLSTLIKPTCIQEQGYSTLLPHHRRTVYILNKPTCIQEQGYSTWLPHQDDHVHWFSPDPLGPVYTRELQLHIDLKGSK